MSRPLPNFEKYQHYFNGMNFSIDESHFNKNTKITIHCSNGHKYYTSITKIENLNHNYKECPHCKKNKKEQIKQIHKDYFKEWSLINNVEILNKNEYLSKWKDSLIVKCKLCEHEEIIKNINYFLKNNVNKKYICEGCINKNIIEKKQKVNQAHLEYILSEQPVIPQKKSIIHNIPLNLKNKIESQSKWSLLEYENTKKKCIYCCNECGYEKKCYPYSIFNGRGFGCQGCKQIKNKEIVKHKIIDKCKENDIYPIDDFKNSYIDVKFKCIKCDHIFNRKWIHINGYQTLSCPNCSNRVKRKTQNELANFIKEHSSDLIENERTLIKPFELDIVIPSKKIAIEYCGSIWHSEKYKKDKNYHKNKMIMCNEKGYRLLTIFEEEWIDKKEICKSRLLNIIGITNVKIHGRKCHIKQIENKEALEFCEKNHIQGRGNCSIAVGCYYENKLVSVMTFSKPSISKGNYSTDSYEINRFCSLLNTIVIGGANKLLKFFISNLCPANIKQIYSFCDLRWGNGQVYKNIGMVEQYTTSPNYYYTGKLTNWKLKHRYSFTKNKLVKLFPNENGSESEITERNGLFRIWDCGHKKFIINLLL